MTFVNYSARELNVKIVYYGPGLGGKTTNLRHVYARAPTRQKGRLISLATQTERTLFFDFLPLNLGTLRGFQVRFHLYTVPGQVFYAASRRLILKGVDGLVFVADSNPLRLDANAESWADLGRNLAGYGLRRDRVPTVIQYNKRDLEGAVPVDGLRRCLGSPGVPEFEAVAAEGRGVFETLKGVARLVLSNLAQRTPGR